MKKQVLIMLLVPFLLISFVGLSFANSNEMVEPTEHYFYTKINSLQAFDTSIPEKDHILFKFKIVDSRKTDFETSGSIRTAEGYSGFFGEGDNSRNTIKQYFAITGIEKKESEATAEIEFQHIDENGEETYFKKSIIFKTNLPKQIVVNSNIYLIIELCHKL